MDQAERERIREYIKSKHVSAAEISQERQKEIDRLMAGFAAELNITQTGPNDFTITGRDVESDLRGGPSGQDDGVIFAGAMTKGIVMTLPEDAFILSNCCNNDGSPIIVRKVGDLAKRAELWNQIRAFRMNGRRFYVFGHEAGLNAHLARLEKMRARHEERHGG